MFAFLEHWQVQLFADEVVLTTEFFQFSLCDMELSTFFHADAVDDEVGVDMLPIHMGADKHFPVLKESCQPDRCLVSSDRIHLCFFWEGLHQVIIQPTGFLMVEQLGAEEIIISTFGLTVHTGDQRLTFPQSLLLLGCIAHDCCHTAAALSLGRVDEMDNCYFLHLPRFWISRRVALTFASSSTV